MYKAVKIAIAALAGICVAGGASAYAKHKPAYCADKHDHRIHDAHYYDYYPQSRRADKGVSFSITVSDRDYRDRRYSSYDRRGYDKRGYYDGRGYDRRYNGYHPGDSRIISRRVLDTRYRARIIVTEEVRRTRNGRRLVCNVRLRGPEANYVPYRRLKRVARNQCSPRARVKIYA